jgi:hypothetical protein
MSWIQCDSTIDLPRPFPGVEDTPEMMAEPAGHVLDGDLGHQVQIEFRPDPGQRPGQHLGAFLGRELHHVVRHDAVHEVRERGRVVGGPASEPAAHHARLQPVVQPGGHDRVFDAGDHDDLVDERVIRAAPAAQLLAQRVLLLFGHVLDDQDLEIGPVGPRLLHRMGGAIQGLVLGAQVPRLAGAEGVGGQRAVDPAHQGGEPVVLAGREQPAHLAEGRHAGEGPEPLDRPEDVEQVGDGLASSSTGRC